VPKFSQRTDRVAVRVFEQAQQATTVSMRLVKRVIYNLAVIWERSVATTRRRARCVAEKPTLVRINELKPQEQAACLIAVRMLEATRAEAWDIDARQSAVDVMLTLKDGRTAAFEVTNLAAEGALETVSLLARDNHKWPLPGQWFWSITVGTPQDLRQLKQCYENIILICEAASIPYPHQHPDAWSPSADPDLQ
jgi:hypothetical protein